VAGYVLDLSRALLPAGALLGGSVVLAHLLSGIGLPCPLRSPTGLPCPFCGMTTGLRQLGGDHVVRSVDAAPLAVLAAVVAFLVLIGRAPARVTVALWLLVPVLVAEWVYELVRLHLL